VGHRLSPFVNYKARAVHVRELLNAFGCDNFYEFYLSVFNCNLRKMVIDEVAKLVTILIQMEYYEILRGSVCDFSYVLISRDLNDLAIFNFLRF
jgi:hypothetical protein